MMFSRFQYPSFKALNWKTKKSIPRFLVIILVVIFTVLNYEWMPAVLFLAYLLYGVLRSWLSREWRREIEEEIGEEASEEGSRTGAVSRQFDCMATVAVARRACARRGACPITSDSVSPELQDRGRPPIHRSVRALALSCLNAPGRGLRL